jgi:hypothetical protein
VGPAFTLWISFVATLEVGALLSWERLEGFMMSHFGRLESPEFILPKFDALTLASAGSVTSYVSRFQTLLARLGPGRSVADDVHRFLRGLPSSLANQLRLKFAGTQATVQAYIDSLCALPDDITGTSRAATQDDLRPKNAGITKAKGKGSGKTGGPAVTDDDTPRPKGPKCYRCGQFGHIAKNCPSKVVPSDVFSGPCEPRSRLSGSKRSFEQLNHGRCAMLYTCSDAALAAAREPDGCTPRVSKLTFVMGAAIQGRAGRVRCLLDSGATSCFVSRKLLKRLGLRTAEIASRCIVLPDGTEEHTTQCCQVPLRVNGRNVHVPCLVANLDSHEIILGETFLALTDAQLCWKTKKAELTLQNERVVVAMDVSPEPAVPTVNAVQA